MTNHPLVSEKTHNSYMSKPSTSATVSSKANLCALFLLSAALSCLGQSAGYKTIFLGENTSAVALNNRGEVLVCSNSPDGQQFLKMWSTNSGFNQLPVIPNLYIQIGRASCRERV